MTGYPRSSRTPRFFPYLFLRLCEVNAQYFNSTTAAKLLYGRSRNCNFNKMISLTVDKLMMTVFFVGAAITSYNVEHFSVTFLSIRYDLDVRTRRVSPLLSLLVIIRWNSGEIWTKCELVLRVALLVSPSFITQERLRFTLNCCFVWHIFIYYFMILWRQKHQCEYGLTFIRSTWVRPCDIRCSWCYPPATSMSGLPVFLGVLRNIRTVFCCHQHRGTTYLRHEFDSREIVILTYVEDETLD